LPQARREGIVSKRLGSPYRSGRSKDWLKFKNPVAPAVKREAEEDWGRERWWWNEEATGAYLLGNFVRALAETITRLSRLLASCGKYSRGGIGSEFDDESTPAYELRDEIEPSAASPPKSLKEFYDRALSDQFIEAVDPKTCRRYLGRQERLQCSVEFPLPIITEEPWGTIAAQIEANLDLGDDEKRIDTLLMNYS
jgi:hypothetical protein